MESEEKKYSMIDALFTRDQVKGSPYMNAAAARQNYLDDIASCAYTREQAQAEIAEVIALIEEGNRLFDLGYRLHYGERRVFGLTHDVPRDSVETRLVQYGHIATTETYRLLWVTSNIPDVLTPREIEAEFSLQPGTVRAYLGRHPEAGRKAPGTWLMHRAEAERIWGHHKQS